MFIQSAINTSVVTCLDGGKPFGGPSGMLHDLMDPFLPSTAVHDPLVQNDDTRTISNAFLLLL